MKISACIFDLDGTLLNTLDDLADSLNPALLRAGLPAHPVSAYKQFVGGGADLLVQRAAPQADEELRRRLTQIFLEQYAAKQMDKTGPYDGIKTLLSELARRGIKLGVLSNKMHENTVRITAHYFPGVFETVIGQIDGVPPKPDTAGPNNIIRQMGLHAEQTLYIGDSDVDMYTAGNAGFYAVGAAWGFRGEAELTGAGADAVIGHPLELLGLIDRLTSV